MLTPAAVDETQPPEVSAPTMALTTYTVQPGDTLGSIALDLDVDVETLMEINGLQDRDAIGANMVLFVPLPVSDQPPPEKAPTSAPTPAAYSSDDPQISIVSVVGAGDVDTERVVLRRAGSGELPLAGWSLETGSGERYYFPQLILYADGAVSVHSAAGVNSVVDLYWGRSTAAWPSGSQVRLLDPAGELHASYRVP
jgi:LysM repeat protein